MFNTPCILFAGGKSSRMGQDKSLLPFGGFATLTEYQYSKLTQIFQDVYISTKNPAKFSFSATFLIDLSEFENIYAPSAGFITAFKKLQTEKIFVLSVDTPFVQKETITKLLTVDTTRVDATVAKTPLGVQTMCGVYHRTLLEKFIHMQKEQNYKLQSVLKDTKVCYVNFDDEKLFLNLNHLHEYQEALNLLNS